MDEAIQDNRSTAYGADQPVSVVLVCRNKSSELPRVVKALARNTRRPDLVILSDDASTDDSIEHFERLCRNAGLEYRVVPHPTEGNFRINTLRNDGMKASPDGLTIIVDADLEVAPTYIAAHREMHLKRAGGVISTGPRLEYGNADGTGPVHFMWGHEPLALIQPSENEPLPAWCNVIGGSTGITRRGAEEIGWFDEAYDGNYGFDDADFMYRAWKKGYFFAGSFEAYCIHLPHPSLGDRAPSPNKRRLEDKYGVTIAYPPLIRSIARARNWNLYYQDLREQFGDGTVDGPLRSPAPVHDAPPWRPPQAIELDNVGGKLLLKAMWTRMRRKLGLSARRP